MTSIPVDPTITLGNIVTVEKIDALIQIAEATKPAELANDRLNNLILSNYKIKMIHQQMVNMKVPLVTIEELVEEMTKLKMEMAEAAIELAKETITSERNIRDLKRVQAQKQISYSAESPLSWENTQIKPIAISYDSLKFDVNFFNFMKSDDQSSSTNTNDVTEQRTSVTSGEQAEDGTGPTVERKSDSENHAENVAAYVSDTFQAWGDAPGGSTAASHRNVAQSSTASSSVNSSIEGTIVICAKCTHKMADMLAPCIFDARKTVAAWNYYYPEDYVKTDPTSIYRAAGMLGGGSGTGDEKRLRIVSGFSRGSSFVGFAHVLKMEKTETSQETSSKVSAVTEAIQRTMFLNQMQGNYGQTSEQSSATQSVLSSSNLTASCSLNCEGVIPSIKANSVAQAINRLKPDPSNVVQQMEAISSSANATGGSSIEEGAGNAANGASFIQLNNEHLANTASVLAEQDTAENKVIDINSMMTAFEDYVNKAIEGSCGVPINFYIKEIDKMEVAKIYIRKFFPNGALNVEDAQKGMMGSDNAGGADTSS